MLWHSVTQKELNKQIDEMIAGPQPLVGRLNLLVNWLFNPAILWCYGWKRWKQPTKCANRVMWEDRKGCGKFFTEAEAIKTVEKRAS